MAQPRRKRYADFTDGSSDEKSFLADITPELLGELVVAVLNVGDAVLFGVTRNGGAVRVILMSGDEKSSTYLNSATDVDAFAKRVTQHLRETYT